MSGTSKKSHHSGGGRRQSRNVSVSSLPTITEERNKRSGAREKGGPAQTLANSCACSVQEEEEDLEEEKKGSGSEVIHCPKCNLYRKNNKSKSVKDKRLAAKQAEEEEKRGQVTEAGIADEEDSSADSSDSDQSRGNPHLQSRFFANTGGIQEAADADEMDEPREYKMATNAA